jgi:hypothetical protein
MDGWRDGGMDGRTDGRMDRQTDRQTGCRFHIYEHSTFSEDLLSNIKTPGGRNLKIIRKLYWHSR